MKKLLSHIQKRFYFYLIFLLFCIFLSWRADRLYFIQEEDLEQHILTPINWNIEDTLEVNTARFINTHMNQKNGYQENISAHSSNLLELEQEKSDILGPIRGLWVTKSEYNRDSLKFENQNLIWPITNHSDWLIVDRLEYPTVTKCTPQNYCIIGLDFHFRKHKSRYNLPIIRYLYSALNKKEEPFATKDTYLAVYKIPQTERLILSNPCPSKEIVAYELSGVSESGKQYVSIRCLEGSLYTGELSI